MQASWFARCGALATAALLALAIAQSCAGQSQTPGHPPVWSDPVGDGSEMPSAPAGGLPPLSGLPALPGEEAAGPARAASYQSLYFAWGNAIYDASDDALFAGDGVTLLSSAASLGWAVYPFNTGDFSPIYMHVNFSASSNAPVYLGISDYADGAWRFYGPYQSPTTVSLPNGDYQNSFNQCFVAVVVFGGSSATVNHLYVQTDNGQPAGLSISGQVTDEHSDPVAGIKLTCDAPGNPIVWTDSAGGYEFNGLSDGTYTIAPDMFDTFTSSFSFNVSDQIVQINGADETGINFTVERHDIFGRVALAGGTGVAGVMMTREPGGATVSTSGNGQYVFTDVPNGNYTITPLLAGYTFDPVSVDVSVAGADADAADIVASGGAPTFSLSGHIQDDGLANMEGVAVTIVPTYRLAFTDASGNYQFDDLAPAEYTLTAGKGVYEFNPASRTVTITDSDVTGADFIGSLPVLWTVAGNVDSPGGKPLVDLLLKVEMSNPTGTMFIYTDENGVYAVDLPDGCNATITPQKFGMTFTPPYRIYAGIGTHSTNDDYTGGYSPEPTYENFTQFYLAEWCLSCHAPTAENSVNPMLQTYSLAETKGAASNVRIQADTMPPGGGNYASDQEFFQAWLDAGMPES